MHEQKFVELVVFQANTNVYQAYTNAFLKNLEIQVGQLALNLQNQSKDSFPSDTKKNLKDRMVITLRSIKEVQIRKAKKRQKDDEAEKGDKNQVGGEKEQNKTELTDESGQLKVQSGLQT